MKMHVDVISRDQDGCDTEDQRRVEFVTYCGFDAMLVAVG